MNQYQAKDAIKTLIETNNASLITGLTHQGQPRKINQLTTSILTPPTAYYYISIDCTSAQDKSGRGRNINVAVPNRIATYEMAVLIGDDALGTTGEDELYETMHGDFLVFVDRVATVIGEASYIPTSTAAYRYRISKGGAESDRLVRVENFLANWETAEAYHAMLCSQLTFTIEEC